MERLTIRRGDNVLYSPSDELLIAERLAEYEDADEAGLIVTCHCEGCAHKEWRGNSNRVHCPKTHSWRDVDDFCKFAEKK